MDVRAHLTRIVRYFLPYWTSWLLILLSIAASALLGLLPPLLIKSLIDRAIPEQDGALLNVLALGMVLVPLAAGLVGVQKACQRSQRSAMTGQWSEPCWLPAQHADTPRSPVAKM